METIAFCEIDPFCRKVLNKHWPDVPIFEDVKLLRGEHVGPIDLICGGYPCQPFSLAGKRAGAEDDRHLWPEVFRLLQELRPAWFIGENVAGHITMGLDEVLSDLESIGYACQTFVIPACAVDSNHRRDRVWIVANTSGGRCSKQEEREIQQPRRTEAERARLIAHTDSNSQPGGTGNAKTARVMVSNANRGQCETGCECSRREKGCNSCQCGESAGVMGNTDGIGLQVGEVLCRGEGETRQPSPRKAAARTSRWPVEPGVGRVANGVLNRSHRLRALGNAVVPQIPEMIGRAIMSAERLG